MKLCCDKALHILDWQPVLTFKENIQMTSDWYSNYLVNEKSSWDFTLNQIDYYEKLALKKGLTWTV